MYALYEIEAGRERGRFGGGEGRRGIREGNALLRLLGRGASRLIDLDVTPRPHILRYPWSQNSLTQPIVVIISADAIVVKATVLFPVFYVIGSFLFFLKISLTLNGKKKPFSILYLELIFFSFCLQGGFARCYEILNLSTNKVCAGKIISKTRISKPHQKQKVSCFHLLTSICTSFSS